ncbi:SCO-spondin [Thelohanellus kitauei]|uniref:SCO-spondin n=1 Tax=Thelohanellus kitauei TaxID=669202 RepID=A0A0C2MXH4_THEKT|nr:SCO-spondin [Thelohanellus kitauei]
MPHRKCDDFGAFCDDGTCIYLHQVCDDTFHCLDFSDERACIARFIMETNVSCLIKCDEYCLPINKICDHLTDCSDGSDEYACGVRITCPIQKPLHCVDENSCYSYSEKCDRFRDCEDGSDENDCGGPVPCIENEYFLCQNKSICFSHVCDDNFNCDDQSDETYYCSNKNHLRGIRIDMLDHGIVSFNWDMTTYRFNFEVIIRSVYISFLFSDQNIDVASVGNKNNKFEYGEHLECGRYVIFVRTDGHIQIQKLYLFKTLENRITD